MHYEVTPDLIACGKGMGGGVPLSGVIGRAEVMDLPEVGNMSSTHSANPGGVRSWFCRYRGIRITFPN